MEVITESSKKSQIFGRKIGRDLKSGRIRQKILALYGELGSGKTTFVQGLAGGLGIKRRIISPTFIFIRSYPIPGGEKTFYHVDLYRIQNTKEASGLGLEEIFADKKAVVAIEWAERVKEILPPKRVDLHFKYLNQEKRKIKLTTYFNTI